MKNLPLLFLLVISISTSCKNDTHDFYKVASFKSNFVGSRTIQIYIPPGYSRSNKDYPVLYMQDGQMLFDSTTTWNKQEWGVDETMNRLIEEEVINPAIVVGIWNGGDQLRHPEYFPQRPFESLKKSIQDSIYDIKRSKTSSLFGEPIQSDSYLKFIVSELKPFIDSTFRTKSDSQNTFIAGSSMGGLLSMYAICEYPQVFGGAACLSTHWPGIFTATDNPIPDTFLSYLANNLPDPKNHKLYFDYGTETLDAWYEPYQLRADSIIISKGYDEENFLSKKFNGDPHDEKAWNRRFHIPLTFLLSN